MRRLKDYLVVSLKGACMGAADVIPGVSGGTIAFIMGIYDEFVGSIAKVDSQAVQLLMKGKLRDFWKHVNGNFLLSLFAGIGVSVVVLADPICIWIIGALAATAKSNACCATVASATSTANSTAFPSAATSGN